MDKSEESLWDIEETGKGNNTCIMRTTGEEKEKGTEIIFKPL